MEKEFIPYELALRMKALGFDERCFKCYYKDTGTLLEGSGNVYDTLAPTFSQAFRWFRERHSLYSAVIPYNPKKDYYECVVRGIEEEDEDDDWEVNDTYGYSEAELACLDKLIEIVEGIGK